MFEKLKTGTLNSKRFIICRTKTHTHTVIVMVKMTYFPIPICAFPGSNQVHFHLSLTNSLVLTGNSFIPSRHHSNCHYQLEKSMFKCESMNVWELIYYCPYHSLFLSLSPSLTLDLPMLLLAKHRCVLKYGTLFPYTNIFKMIPIDDG